MSASFARQALLPFTLVYAAGVRFKNVAYDRRLVRPAQLAWPAISVGNLSVGGAGKTSMVLLLARLLTERGWAVDVLSRGHGRRSKRVARVDPQGAPAEFGDEPLLLARHGLPVYVGAERFQAGMLAETEAATETGERPRLHLLDDAFQHRRLTRTIDLLLLRRTDLTGDMLPVGRLREPLSSLARADICVLRAEDADLTNMVLELMRTRDSRRVWLVERKTVLPERRKQRAFAFCALGDSQGFFRGLRDAGLDLQGTMAFRDHRMFEHKDMLRIEAAARASRAELYVTSEKDAVRLDPALRAALGQELPLTVAGLEVSLRNEDTSMAMLGGLVAERLQISLGGVR